MESLQEINPEKTKLVMQIMFMCLHARLTLIATLLLGIELLPMPVNPLM
jgi:hypothetical protein